MDLRHSNRSPGNESGSGSWHPALRPNAHKLEANGEQVDVHSCSDEYVNGDATLHRSTAHPVGTNEERLVNDPPEEHSGLSRAIAQGSEHSDHGEIGALVDIDMIGKVESHDQTMENDRNEEVNVDPGDSGPGRAGLTGFQHAPEQVAEKAQEEVTSSYVKGIASAGTLSEPDFTEGVFGDDEEIDKAFELESTTLGPGSISRTNSFPSVPHIGNSLAIPPHSLPHSQVEDIMEENENINGTGYEHSSDPFSATSGDGLAPRDPFESIRGEEDEDFFVNRDIQTSVSALEVDEESRYEEGLPLMPSNPQHEQSTRSQSPIHATEAASFEEKEAGAEPFEKAGFEVQEDTHSFKPHPLNRKSTTQVLSSMHYAPHNTNHVEPKSIEERHSITKTSDGGNVLSTSTVKPQIFAEQQMDLVSPLPKEEDLAEMWKAALADDDLLEEDGTSMDPSGFFGDDDEGFLEGSDDQADDQGPQPASPPPIVEPVYGRDDRTQGFGNVPTGSASSQNRYMPAAAPQPQANPFASYNGVQQLHSTLGSQNPLSSHTGFQNIGQSPFAAEMSPSRPHMPASTQSFADKSKGGYTSPYDLPMDVTRPRKRATNQQSHPSSDAQIASTRLPPPRSSSMFTGAPTQIQSQPPLPIVPNTYGSGGAANVRPPAPKATPSAGSFFEELMPSSKPRPSSSVGRALPPTSQPPPALAPSVSSQVVPPGRSSIPQPVSSAPATSPSYQLLPPERMSIYDDEPPAKSPRQALPVTNPRYSPAPPQPINALPPSNRYAASPSGASRPPFQPRTSSPLAQHSALSQQGQQHLAPNGSLRRPQSSDSQGPSLQRSTSPSYPNHGHRGPPIEDPTIIQQQGIASMADESQPRVSDPTLHSFQNAPLSNVLSDSSYMMNTPEADQFPLQGSTSFQQSHNVGTNPLKVLNHGQPQRSQTQSPGTARYRPGIPPNPQIPYQRPASVNHQVALPSTETGMQAVSPSRPRGRTFSKNLNYIKPSDGRELDQLERWKGCPIFSFGFGGSIVTTFPKKVPRYAAGQSIPMIKCSPGEVKLQDASTLPLGEDIAAFPGPLKSKGKKKDVLEWLQKRITTLDSGASESPYSVNLPDPRKRHDEKILLWKIVKVIVEHDGVIDGSPSVEKAVRVILSPDTFQGDSTNANFQSSNTTVMGITRRSGSNNIPDSVSVEAIEELRKTLLQGEREKAVWHAVDNRMWAHAMLLSSTLDQSIWRQVSQEFVRQEIKTFGENTEPLAALYQIFAGNWGESVDELVPPSARAGLQMVSKSANTGPTRNALDGLDRWRETLTLVLSNRTPEDGQALLALGQLLSSYGRTEAAHICFLFTKAPSLFGGPDDPQVSVALLGADHLQRPSDYDRDLDSILLTEVYDFARTVLSPSSVATVSPHLQSYKLYHAMILAEYGHKSEAQQYCEVITSALNSTTKRSPYYHNPLLAALDNLVDRLRQAPRDSSGSWISKPSIDKVSGSLWAKFNQYVAGDESDAASTGSGRANEHHVGSADAGPFAGVTGDSPNLSRTPSSSDLYGSFAPGLGTSPSAATANPTNTRYAPAGLYTPKSSLEQPGRSSSELQRPMTSDSLRPALAHQQYQSRPTSSAGSHNEPYQSTPLASSYAPRSDSYLPTPPSQPEYMPVAPPNDLSSSLYPQQSYQPTPPLEPQQRQEEYQPQSSFGATDGYEPPSLADLPPSSTYEPPSYDPPTISSYDPPIHDTVASQASESPVEGKRKAKSFMDDDEDDFEARAAAMRKEEKARKDREAEEAFKRAAEADAQKDNVPALNSKKSGWFGGWLSSKKEVDVAPGTPNAPIKAKLGEQSSFYYDANLKRWIDKKNPDLTPAAAAPPPPPKGPPSRAVSAAGGPRPPTTSTPPVPPLPMATAIPSINSTGPDQPPLQSSRPPSQNHSRSQSPAVHQSENQPTETRSVSMPMATGPPSGPPSAPPSRPGTGMSGASNIDDLIGAPQARKGGTIRKAKKGRGYVDVMAK